MPRLTKSYVDKLQPRARRFDVYCDSLRGFTVRVNADGTKTAGFRYVRDGSRHRVTVGVLGDGFTLDQARRRAEKLRGQVQDGAHPARDRDERRNAPTFAAVAERYMAELARPYRKASTVRGYEGLLRVHLEPALGSMKIGEITRDDVQRLHQRIGASAKGAANRALALVSVIMTNAERWGLRDSRSNPCHRMPKLDSAAAFRRKALALAGLPAATRGRPCVRVRCPRLLDGRMPKPCRNESRTTPNPAQTGVKPAPERPKDAAGQPLAVRSPPAGQPLACLGPSLKILMS